MDKFVSFSHILEIVIGAVLLVISVIIIATVLCKRLAFCPLHRSKMCKTFLLLMSFKAQIYGNFFIVLNF